MTATCGNKKQLWVISGHLQCTSPCPLSAKSGHRPPPLLLQWCNYDRRVKRDWFFARGRRNKDFDGPISSLRQINSINLPGSIGLADCCVVNGQRARVWWVETQLDFVSRKLRKIISQHSNTDLDLSDPTRVDDHVSHGLGCMDMHKGGIGRDTLRRGMLMRRRWQRSEDADAQQDAETKTDLPETVAL